MASPVSKVIWPVLCVSAFAGGWFAGHHDSPTDQKQVGGASGKSASSYLPAEGGKNRGSNSGSNSESGGSGGSATNGTGKKALDAEGMANAIRDALRDPNPLKRNRLIAELMDQLTPDNIQSAIDGMRENGDGPGNFRELALLTYAWGSMDPDKALAYVAKLGGPGTAFGTASVLSGWASHDPDAALKWFKEQKSEGWERGMQARGLIDGLAQANLPEATRLAMAETDPDLQRQFMEVVARQQAQTGGIDATRTWVENLAKSGVSAEAVSTAANELANQWAGKDPKAAAQWAAKLSNPDASRSALQAAYREWGRTDPTAASEYLNQIPASPARDGAVQSFAQSVVREDPEAAAAWVGTIQDSETRVREMVRVGQIWNQSDPEAAQAWAASHLPADQQQAVQQAPDRRWGRGPGGGGRGPMGF